MLELIAFDADDTLWHSEILFHEAQEKFSSIVSPYESEAAKALAVLHETEIRNLPDFGYGIKGFTLSMVEAALRLSSGRMSGEEVQAILGIGRSMLTHDLLMLEGAVSTVRLLSESHAVVLITKGDLFDQERKLERSGLKPFFHHVEIVSDKTESVYAGILGRLGIHPENFLMVGNSLRSDIIPVLSLGGYAVHIPYSIVWAHEDAPMPGALPRFIELKSLGELPAVIRKIDGTGAVSPSAGDAV